MKCGWLAALAATLLVSSTASADVRVTMAQGKVSISAKNATLTQILNEWARVGQTRIVNAERLTGGLMTLELTDVPEIQALEVLLRGAGGYVIASRPVITPATSTFDRILIVPASTTPTRAAAPAVTSPAVFQPTRVLPAPALDPNQEEAAPQAPNVDPTARFRQPSAEAPQVPVPLAAPPSRVPTSPVGVARPGMVAPVPPPTPSAVPD